MLRDMKPYPKRKLNQEQTMSKYIYTIAKMLNSTSGQHRIYNTNTIISDLFDDNIDEIEGVDAEYNLFEKRSGNKTLTGN